jgi:hypothetical protein
LQKEPCPYSEAWYRCFGFGHVTDAPCEDGALVSLKCQDPNAVGGITSPARAMVARPLVHITLGIVRTDWCNFKQYSLL